MIFLSHVWLCAVIFAVAFGPDWAKWISERWRTRHDKGYDASRWGAF